MVNDLLNNEFPKTEWNTDELTHSLDEVYRYVVSKSQKSQQWYYDKRLWKKRCGWALRVTALVSAPLAGVLPVLNGIHDGGNSDVIQPGWATILIALAGLCVMLDRFGGFTSGWVRYVRTAQKIGYELECFQFEWDLRKTKLAGNNPTTEEAQAFLIIARQYSSKINHLISHETGQWAAEFEGVLRQFESTAESVAPSRKYGAIDVTVKNGGQSKSGWQLQIRGRDPLQKIGNRASVDNLTPGLYLIRVEGEVSNKRASDEKTVEVIAGQVTSIEMKLVGTN